MLIELLVDDKHYGNADAEAVPNVGERVWTGAWMIVVRREWNTSKSARYSDEVRLSVGVYLEREDESKPDVSD